MGASPRRDDGCADAPQAGDRERRGDGATPTGRGGRPALLPCLAWFVDEDGYTSVAVALALLVSLTLVFASATACWTLARSDDVQTVADATALAGANAVAAFSTVAQVCDACVLSMGIVGVVVLGAGLVLSCVPVAAAVGPSVADAGRQILDARRSFARSAAQGLSRLESALPALVAANSSSCARASSAGGIDYVGLALPLPLESRSDYGALDKDVGTDELEDLSERMSELTESARASQERADALLDEGWRADCGSSPRCLRERASTLAGLSGAANPVYARDGWNFGVPLQRARAYYAMRRSMERPLSEGVEAQADSAARAAFYDFALDATARGHFWTLPDGSCDIDLPRLPHTPDEVRASGLYTRSEWPCSRQEGGGRVLHAFASCPGARGGSAGTATLADLEAGRVLPCGSCHMGVATMGAVASASTNVDNGFEHWWQRVVVASEGYEAARNEAAEAEGEARELAERSQDAFARALEEVGVARVTLCPPGAWGCVAAVARPSSTTVPAELTRAFLSEATLPEGAAVSAAVLAPDATAGRAGVVEHLADGLASSPSLPAWLAGAVCGLWGRLLAGYAGAYGDAAEAADGLFDALDVAGGLGSWLRGKLSELVRAAALEPADLRPRKPVLANTKDVLGKAGVDLTLLERCVRTLADTGSVERVARLLGMSLAVELTGGSVTVAELPILCTELSIPLTVDLTGWEDAA